MRINILIFCLFLICGPLWAPVPAGAFSYHPETAFMIMSESVSDADEPTPSQNYTWRVEPHTGTADGAKTLLFFDEMSGAQLCTLVISRTGAIRESDIPSVSANMLIKDDGLLLVPGFPVPCDVLPLDPLIRESDGNAYAATRKYQIKRNAGTQTFVDKIEVRMYLITYETAIANGWITGAGVDDPASTLRVIKALDEQSGNVLALQLWPVGGEWWIYEKTAYRQSWRLKVK